MTELSDNSKLSDNSRQRVKMSDNSKLRELSDNSNQSQKIKVDAPKRQKSNRCLPGGGRSPAPELHLLMLLAKFLAEIYIW